MQPQSFNSNRLAQAAVDVIRSAEWDCQHEFKRFIGEFFFRLNRDIIFSCH